MIVLKNILQAMKPLLNPSDISAGARHIALSALAARI